MRPEKVHIVADIQTKLKNSPFLLIADYSGMQVKHFEELRLRLARVDAEIHVIKNTFIKRAIKAWACLSSTALSRGQTAMVTGESDICAAAKVLKNFCYGIRASAGQRHSRRRDPERRPDQGLAELLEGCLASEAAQSAARARHQACSGPQRAGRQPRPPSQSQS